MTRPFGIVLLALLSHLLILPNVARAAYDWTPIPVPDIQLALGKPECQKNGYFKPPDLHGYALRSLDFLFDPTTRDFRGQPREAILARQRVQVDADWIRPQFESEVRSQIPHGCDVYGVEDFSYSVASDGRLHASVIINYQARTCTDGFCYGGMACKFIFCYPVLYRCTWATDIPGATVRTRINTTITPSLQELPDGSAVVRVLIEPKAEKLEGVSNALLNIVGLLTAGIGSKYIRDKVDHSFSDFSSSLTPKMRTVGFVDLPKARPTGIQIDFKPDQPSFGATGPHLYVNLEQHTIQDPSVAWDLRRKMFQVKLFFDSCLRPQRTYTVRPGDSLWTIADSLYGDGQYFHVVADANGFSFAATEPLHAGQVLKVPAFYEVVGEGSVLVEAGDTLWSVAKKTLGEGRLYQRLVNANPDRTSDPKRLSTIVRLKLPPR